MSSGADLLLLLQSRRTQQQQQQHQQRIQQRIPQQQRVQQQQQIDPSTIIDDETIMPVITSHSTKPTNVLAEKPKIIGTKSCATAGNATTGTGTVITIIVCTGSNCGSTRGRRHLDTLGDNPGGHGCGVSATLLEIEELVQEFKQKSTEKSTESTSASTNDSSFDKELPLHTHCSHPTERIKVYVKSGGCVGHCSVGPTVSVTTDSATGTTGTPIDDDDGDNDGGSRFPVLRSNRATASTWNVHYFHRINTVPACAQVVQEVMASCARLCTKQVQVNDERVDASASASATNRHADVLMRRAEGLRWKALKELSREVARPLTTGTRATGAIKPDATEAILSTAKIYMAKAIQAELVAVGPVDQEKVNRAHRRQKRFDQVFARNESIRLEYR